MTIAPTAKSKTAPTMPTLNPTICPVDGPDGTLDAVTVTTPDSVGPFAAVALVVTVVLSAMLNPLTGMPQTVNVVDGSTIVVVPTGVWHTFDIHEKLCHGVTSEVHCDGNLAFTG
jgi:hypothetical protein